MLTILSSTYRYIHLFAHPSIHPSIHPFIHYLSLSITHSFHRPKGDVEVDAQIEASLAGEASLIVLDTIELLVSNVGNIENLQSVLGKGLEVLLHLMFCNQSVEVMKCIFATQRA